MGDQVVNRSNVTSRLKRIHKETPFFCKIIELIICVIAVGLIVDPFNSPNIRPAIDHAGIVHVSICGYIMINGIIIICYLLGERQPKKMSIIFSVLGAVLCCASGIVLIKDWSNLRTNLISNYHDQYSNQMVASGIFSLFGSLVFIIDAILTNKYE